MKRVSWWLFMAFTLALWALPILAEGVDIVSGG